MGFFLHTPYIEPPAPRPPALWGVQGVAAQAQALQALLDTPRVPAQPQRWEWRHGGLWLLWRQAANGTGAWAGLNASGGWLEAWGQSTRQYVGVGLRVPRCLRFEWCLGPRTWRTSPLMVDVHRWARTWGWHPCNTTCRDVWDMLDRYQRL